MKLNELFGQSKVLGGVNSEEIEIDILDIGEDVFFDGLNHSLTLFQIKFLIEKHKVENLDRKM
jgi:hypothetical protein